MKSDSSIFIWNLYQVEFSNFSTYYVCAPSVIGAIKRAQSYIRSLDKSDHLSISKVIFVSNCIN